VWRRLTILLWSAVLSGVLLWPTKAGGYLLGHDMVFTPNQPLDAASFGLASRSPRAVPLDALVAIAGHLIGGAAVGRLALLTPLVFVGLGVAELLGNLPVAGGLGAATVAIWNPYVIERLAVGQWALLWAYAALPWLLIGLRRNRAWGMGACALAAASITPTGGVIAVISAVVLSHGKFDRRRDRLLFLALAAALQLPWLIPALVSTARATSDPAAVAAFSSRGERPGGPLLSLLDGGGIWDADVVPSSRGGVLGWLWLIFVVLALLAGWRVLRRSLGGDVWDPLVGLATVGLLVAALSSMAGGSTFVENVVADVPGAGLVRDAQKWVMPLVLLEALSVGAVASWISSRIRPTAWRGTITVLACAVPLLLLPDGPATLRPVLRPVHYPKDWAHVVAEARGSDAVVLPFGSYRSFPWAPGRSVLDPAPRLLHVPTVVDDRLAVSGHLLKGEDPRAAAVAALLSDDQPLAAGLGRLGIGWVVVEHGTPGAVPDLRGLTPVYLGSDVSLYRVPGVVTAAHSSDSAVAAVAVGDAVAGIALGCSLIVGVRRRRDRPRALL
jgi:hypothetical protein